MNHADETPQEGSTDTPETEVDSPEIPEIKDPIYDIMSDEEAQESFDRLMKLAEESESEDSD